MKNIISPKTFITVENNYPAEDQKTTMLTTDIRWYALGQVNLAYLTIKNTHL